MSGIFEDNIRLVQVSQSQIVMADLDAKEVVSVQSVTHIWNTLTWADRAYYRAKYGFSEDGGFLSGSIVDQSKAGSRMRILHSGQMVLPVDGLPGSDDRLLKILAQSRVGVENLPYSDGLAHTGPDGTVIITDEYFWGLPHHYGSDEITEKYRCVWEASGVNWVPEAPWWAVGPYDVDVSEFA